MAFTLSWPLCFPEGLKRVLVLVYLDEQMTLEDTVSAVSSPVCPTIRAALSLHPFALVGPAVRAQAPRWFSSAPITSPKSHQWSWSGFCHADKLCRGFTFSSQTGMRCVLTSCTQLLSITTLVPQASNHSSALDWHRKNETVARISLAFHNVF